MLNKIISRSLVVLALAAATSAGETQELTPHVSLCRDSVNGVFIESQDQVLVIYGDPAGRLEKAEKVLFTDSRRDLVWAGRRLVDNGAESVVPAEQVDRFAKVDDFWSGFVKNRFHDYAQQTTKILTEPLKVGRTARGGDVIKWRDLSVRVLETPGYSRDSVSYFVDVDGRRYAFVGDLIYGDGHLFDLYSLQDAVAEAKIGGYHGYAGRIGDLISSLREVLKQNPDILIPARGSVVETPESSVNLLIQRLQAAYSNYLSINAGHWYFKERYETLARRALGSPADVDWMAYATVIKKSPPDWIIPIHNSRLVLSKDGAGLLIDCGSNAIIEEVKKLVKAKRLSGLDGIYITHYHDDHTDKVTELVRQFQCPVYSCRELADVLEHPEGYRLPAMTANRIEGVASLAHGQRKRWKEFGLTSYYFPGQTLYHGALLVERDDGQKIFFIGDSFTPSGIDDYCLLNRNLLHSGTGYFYCLDLLLNMPQDYLLINQHVVETFRFSKPQLEHMAEVLTKRTEILAELFPWDEPNYGIDERWARIHPYSQKVRPGQEFEIEVKILNNSGSSKVFTVKPSAPDGFGVRPLETSINIEPCTEVAVRFSVTAPGSISENLRVITCDIGFDKWDLRHWCESMLEISP